MSCGGSGPMFEIGQGDRLPALVVDVMTCDGEFDFTGWTLTLKLLGPVQRSGSATGDINGTVTYTWAAGDTDVAGDYEAVIVGVSPGGLQQTFIVSGVVRVRST